MDRLLVFIFYDTALTAKHFIEHLRRTTHEKPRCAICRIFGFSYELWKSRVNL